jgi:hypothetical protein
MFTIYDLSPIAEQQEQEVDRIHNAGFPLATWLPSSAPIIPGTGGHFAAWMAIPWLKRPF